MVKSRLLAITPTVMVCVLLSLFGSAAARAQPSGGASWLPDERVYEQVSPPEKNGGDVGGSLFGGAFASGLGESSVDGNAITYVSLSAFGDSQSAVFDPQYLSVRSANGWTTTGISPPATATGTLNLTAPPYHMFDESLSSGVLSWEADALASGAPEGVSNLYLRTNSGSYQLIDDVMPPNRPLEEYTATFAGASPDLQHILFEADDALTPGAPADTRSLYEWTESSPLRLVSILPGPGAPAAESSGSGDRDDDNYLNVVSTDGTRVFWTSGEGQLYVRENATSTVQLNASQRTGVQESGRATLEAVTPSGSRAIFTDPTALTNDPGDGGGGLYSYELESGALEDLTPDGGANPEFRGVLGMSDDGSSVYFVAAAALAEGAIAGEDNLYLTRGGALTFIATLDEADQSDWSQKLEGHTAEVTPNGAYVAFMSDARLTGYDNMDASSGAPDSEVFLYDSLTGELRCVSCNPSGARPVGPSRVLGGLSPGYMTRFLSDGGARLFFDSDDALLPIASNGLQDVYEYENGQIYLISSGTSDGISSFADASANGDDVFFTTRAQLVASDHDESSDMYDARVDGGFPSSPTTEPCAGEACLGELSVPPAPLPIATTSAGESEGSVGATEHKPKAKHRRPNVKHKRPDKKAKHRKPRSRRRQPSRIAPP